ncbi:asparagine synthase-related protein [Halomonas mongoliensis]|uniref:asparagine synthase-related protein n=1 Tax=Halomonas mongoliensis TaxID=321265 RepID=UPI00403B168B
MPVQLHLTSSGWKDRANGKLKQLGTCWQDPEDLVQASTYHEISKVLEQQNGFYALVWEQGGKLYAAVDHIRSIPLYYGIKGDAFFLSDNAEWVRKKVGNIVMDELSKEEFQLTGYVTGQETLYPDVKQLQAGEFLSINTNVCTPQLKTERYYRFLHTEPENFDEQALYHQLDAAALASIDNLISYANGRQIVIPLSGGYDSRLIASLLKRRGYKNILTFTYGVPGNKESAYSKKVADALGLKWHFIEYSNELWSEIWKTDERWEYQKWASGWSSLSHVQDWLAVKILKQNAIVEQDCIFVPGHTGDFISGGHVPDNAIKDKKASCLELFETIYKKHYSLAPSTGLSERGLHEWSDRILEKTEQAVIWNGQDLANAFEKWEWQERQAKFICNSVRVYEFYGYDWWLPLWDMNFCRFWQGVPLEIRKGREWYISYVSSQFKGIAKPQMENLENASDKSRLVNFLRNNFLIRHLPFKENLKAFIKGSFVTKGVLSSSGRYPEGEYRFLVKEGYSSNGIYAHFFLGEVERKNAFDS